MNLDALDYWAEYDAAAEWCARRGLDGRGELPLLLMGGACRLIERDREAFARRVEELRAAMEARASRERFG